MAAVNSAHPDLVRLQRILKYIMILLLVRLVRFILRFLSGFTLMLIAFSGWFCRKRVKKGRLPHSDRLIDASDGILLIGLNQR
jgi:hypothetical protein